MARFSIYTRIPGGAFVQAFTQGTLDAAFDAAIATATRERNVTDVIVHDANGTTPAARYFVVKSGSLGREPE